jgi:transposase
MIRFPAVLLVATEPVNLHLSFDRLAGIVREHLGGDPRSETLVVFHNRRRTHVKLLWHDGRGYLILYKRIDRGRYRIPLAIPPDARSVTVSRRELEILLEGIDKQAVRRVVRLARSG